MPPPPSGLSNTGSIFEIAKLGTRVQTIGSEARTTSVLFVPRAVPILVLEGLLRVCNNNLVPLSPWMQTWHVLRCPPSPDT